MNSSYSKVKSKGMIIRNAFLLCVGILLLNQIALAGQITASVFDESYNNDQRAVVSVHYENEPLSQVLQELARKVDVGISYETETVPSKLVTYEAENKSIFEILDAILEDTGLFATLSENRKVILIKEKQVLPVVQQETITGIVTDASSGETMPGVNILVKGTSTGAATDTNGEYELTVESLQDTLVISFIGYKAQEVPIDGRSTVDIAMQSKVSGLEEIVVLARSRREAAQDVPITGANFSAQTITDAGIESPGDFLDLTSNVTFAESDNVGWNFITIRGVSQNRNTEAPVAVVVDGVLQISPKQFNQQQFDLQSIEVLKGPQGPLYGRNAVGGAILINTREPTNNWEGYTSFGIGNGEHREWEAALSGPLIDNKLLFRLSGRYQERDGYFSNIVLDKNVDYTQNISARGKLRWVIAPNVKADFKYSLNRVDAGSMNWNYQPAIFEQDGVTLDPDQEVPFDFTTIDANSVDRNFEANNLGRADRNIDNVSLKLEYSSNFATIRSVTSFTKLKLQDRSDQYPYTKGLTRNVPGFGNVDGTSTTFNDTEAWSQEIRIISPADQKFRWMGGVYYLSTDLFSSITTGDDLGGGVLQVQRKPFFDSDVNPTLTFSGDDNKNEAWAAFGNIAYDVFENIELSAGFRYDRDHREQTVSEFNTSSIPGDVKENTFDQFQPKFTLRFMPNISTDYLNNLNVYSSWGIGFRSGSFNQSGIEEAAKEAGLEGVQEIADQEVAKTFELGIKSEWFNRRFRLNGSFFHTRDEGMPFYLFVGSVGAQIIVNVEESTITGVEGEAQANIFKGLDTYFTMGYTQTEITKYPVNTEFEGNKLPLVPQTTINLGVQYQKEIFRGIGILARIDYERRGEQYWVPTNNNPRDALSLLNFRAGINNKNWSLTLEGDNITDEKYNSEFVAGGFAHPAAPDSWKVKFLIGF
jgi:iron complex outermembrane receptor protein